jgi:hypothetical protein
MSSALSECFLSDKQDNLSSSPDPEKHLNLATSPVTRQPSEKLNNPSGENYE